MYVFGGGETTYLKRIGDATGPSSLCGVLCEAVPKGFYCELLFLLVQKFSHLTFHFLQLINRIVGYPYVSSILLGKFLTKNGSIT